ncbi:hypothetical protein I551_4862 [Mycobacterium ulcerans str. Harvey]|uniref:Uncharacterized protein n=1 Tax=Mycobacterium ulcerans str. Harvey TaxID=1299332 RepID=A0ABN0QVH5_MYCUL|nr:hypothetical protein I551_4862 [Mycobacterium ulcerans str. Harvey]
MVGVDAGQEGHRFERGRLQRRCGGHLLAAGYSTTGSIDDVVASLLAALG